MVFWEPKIMKGANSRVIGQIYETPILYVSPKIKVARGESFRYYFDGKDFVNNWDQSSYSNCRRQIILIVSNPALKLYILKTFRNLSITIIIMKTICVVNSITFLALQAWNCTVLIDLFWPIEFDFVKTIPNQRKKRKITVYFKKQKCEILTCKKHVFELLFHMVEVKIRRNILVTRTSLIKYFRYWFFVKLCDENAFTTFL